MIETLKLGLIKLPKTTDSLKELMCSKETEKMSEKSFLISNAFPLKINKLLCSQLMEKSLHNCLPSPHTQYHTTVDQANQFIKQEPFRVES